MWCVLASPVCASNTSTKSYSVTYFENAFQLISSLYKWFICQRDCPSTGSLTKWPQKLGQGYAKAKSQGFHRGFSPEWQWPNSLGHHLLLFQTHSQWPVPEVGTWIGTLIRNAGIPSTCLKQAPQLPPPHNVFLICFSEFTRKRSTSFNALGCIHFFMCIWFLRHFKKYLPSYD